MTEEAPIQDWSKEPIPPVVVSVLPNGTSYAVKFPYHPRLLGLMREVWPRHWNKAHRFWTVPIAPGALDRLKEVFGEHLFVENPVNEKIKEAAELTQRMEALKMEVDMGTELPLPSDMRFVTEPHRHQRQALALCLARPSFGLFMEMGTGKTKVTLDLLAYLKQQGTEEKPWEPALVFCPVSVIDNWVRQGAIHQPSLRIRPLTGVRTTKLAQLHGLREEHQADVIVTNYETSWRILPELQRYYWGAMILDESTRIKNRQALQTKAILKLSAWARRRYILTGTPMPNSPMELFAQIKFLDPSIFGTNYLAFQDRYAVVAGSFDRFRTIVGYKNLDDLAKRISPVTYTVKKKDCLDLPEKIYKEYRFPMTQEQATTYKQMAETLVAQMAGETVTADVMLVKMTKLRQITSGFTYFDDHVLRFQENPKLEKCLELIDELVDNHKVVVWTSFTEELDALEKGLNHCNAARSRAGRPTYASVRLDGSSESRGALVERFQTDEGVKVFLGQQRAGGIGIDLFAGDYCIFFSNDYSPETRLQAEDRLHRIGQKKNVVYIDLLMKGTIDISMKNTLARKQRLTAAVENMGIKEIIYGRDEELDSEDLGSGEGIRGSAATHPGA